MYEFLKKIEYRQPYAQHTTLSASTSSSRRSSRQPDLRSAHNAECVYKFFKKVLQENCHFDPLVARPLTPRWTTPQLDYELDYDPLVALPLTPRWTTHPLDFELDFDPLVALPLTPYWTTPQLDFELDFGLYFDPLVALPLTPYRTVRRTRVRVLQGDSHAHTRTTTTRTT